VYKLLAFDIDGTILRSDRHLSRPVAQALGRLRQIGLDYTLVTGRQWREANIIARKLDLRLPIVCQNGAHILEPGTGRELLHRYVDLDAALALTAALDGAGVVYYWYVGQKIFLPRKALETVLWGSRWRRGTPMQLRGWLRWLWEARMHLRFVPVDDMAAALRGAKVAPTSATVWDRAPEIAATLPAELQAALGLVQNNERSYNVVPAGTSKQQGLAFLADHLGLDRSQVIAVGDQYNDLPMLAWAGLGVAMGNAPDPVKAVSGRVVPSNDEDGVAWLVEQLATGKLA
jgi:hydroxymethylpyrimidine pyrophosphatase-like HAD family hydrolase